MFDTPRLGVVTSKHLEKEFGINRGAYEIARREMFAINNKIYSAKLHAERLAKMAGIDENILVNHFIKLFNNEDSPKFVYKDSFDFLKSCSTLGRVIILTYGEDFVQTPRITKSGLRAAVDDVIVTQRNKADVIGDYLREKGKTSSNSVALIDDSLEHLDAVKEKFPDSITIHLVRNSETATSQEHHRAESLLDAYTILQKSILDHVLGSEASK